MKNLAIFSLFILLILFPSCEDQELINSIQDSQNENVLFEGVLTQNIANSWVNKNVFIIDSVLILDTIVIDKSIKIHFEPHGKFILSNIPNILKINGIIEAGQFQIFYGSDGHFGSYYWCSSVISARRYKCNVDLSEAKITYVYPEWFGANSQDPNDDDTEAMQASISTLANGGKIFCASTGYYKVTSLTVTNPKIQIIGAGYQSQIYFYTHDIHYSYALIVDLYEMPSITDRNFLLQDITISGYGEKNPSSNLISLNYVQSGGIQNVRLLEGYRALVLKGVYYCNFQNITMIYYKYGLTNDYIPSFENGSNASNSNTFNSILFLGGVHDDADKDQIAIETKGMSANTFINCSVEGYYEPNISFPEGGSQKVILNDTLNASNGNTFINLRIERVGFKGKWLEIHSDNNQFTNLLIGCPITNDYDNSLIYFTGKYNTIDMYQMACITDGVLVYVPHMYLSPEAKNNRITINPSDLILGNFVMNQTNMRCYVFDEGTNNLIDFYNFYKSFNQQPL